MVLDCKVIRSLCALSLARFLSPVYESSEVCDDVRCVCCSVRERNWHIVPCECKSVCVICFQILSIKHVSSWGNFTCTTISLFGPGVLFVEEKVNLEKEKRKIKLIESKSTQLTIRGNINSFQKPQHIHLPQFPLTMLTMLL